MESIKILLVDDKVENLLALESLLKTMHVTFYRAASGREALELLLVHEFALSLLDVHMPDMDGFELAELMRGAERTRAIPIIFVTAGASDRFNTFRGYEKGAVDFLYKPLDPHMVKSKVQVFIELASQRQALQAQLIEKEEAIKERDQALHTRDEFMSIASHELKTPLTSLHLQLQMMVRVLQKMGKEEDLTTVKDRFSRGLEVCERQSSKLSELLNELLDLTRIRLGKLQLEKTPVNLVATTKEVLQRFKNELDMIGCSIVLEAEGQVVGFWDLTRIEQVISNLVSNAIKYGQRKPMTIKIGLERYSQVARFEIQDEGIGIPIEMQTKIFQRFERAVSSTKISGLGLGLYITKQIIVAHGGSISVRSEPNKGASFKVELPLSHDAKDLSFTDL